MYPKYYFEFMEQPSLHHAVLNGDIQVVRICLESNSDDLYSYSDDGCLAIHYASWIGSMDIVEICIESADHNHINSTSKVFYRISDYKMSP